MLILNAHFMHVIRYKLLIESFGVSIMFNFYKLNVNMIILKIAIFLLIAENENFENENIQPRCPNKIPVY